MKYQKLSQELMDNYLGAGCNIEDLEGMTTDQISELILKVNPNEVNATEMAHAALEDLKELQARKRCEDMFDSWHRNRQESVTPLAGSMDRNKTQ